MMGYKRHQFILLMLILISLISMKSYAQQKKEKNYNLNAQYLIWKLYYDIPKNQQKIGFLNEKEEIVIQPRFADASDFFGDYANVIADTTFGYIDRKGKTKLFPGYQNLYWYYSDIGIAKKNGKYGLINREGKEITKIDFDIVNIPSEGYFSVQKDKKRNFINEKGDFLFNDSIKIAGSFIFDGKTIFESASNHLGRPMKGLIDVNSKVIIQPIYDELTGYFYEDLMRVKKNGKLGFVNLKDEEIIPAIYDDLGYTFRSGYTTAKKNGKWGIIDKTNKTIIPFEYDGVNNFSEGLALIRQDKKYGYVNEENTVVIPIQYPLIWQADFSEGLAVFKLNEKYGYLNKKGEVVLPAIYEQASQFKNGIAHIVHEGKANFIDKSGKKKFANSYREVFSKNEGLFKFIN